MPFMVKSITLSTIKHFFAETLIDFLKFPIWWYSAGLVSAAKRFSRHLKFGLQYTGLKVWLLSIFKPMFGETSIQGRLISFFMRLILLIFRTMAMIIWFVVSLVIFLLWVILPLFVIFMIVRQLIQNLQFFTLMGDHQQGDNFQTV